MSDVAPIIGVVGCGVTGRRVAQLLAETGAQLVVADTDAAAARHVAGRVAGVVSSGIAELAACDAVVLCHPAPHAALASQLLRAGPAVVSISDDVSDVHRLLALTDVATSSDRPLVIGAAMAPGLSGLLARLASDQLAVLDEVHVAVHGTGGPACARQHHDALGDRAVGWHDGEWVERLGGSGRELLWFPEPIGAHDCYRAALADPLLLQRSFPGLRRVTARVSATRRDRLTARLPMLTPPHRAGGLGAVRVEVRGADAAGGRQTAITGVAGSTGLLAGAVAAAAARACVAGLPAGVHTPGDAALAGSDLLGQVLAQGVRLQEFTGVARSLAW